LVGEANTFFHPPYFLVLVFVAALPVVLLVLLVSVALALYVEVMKLGLKLLRTLKIGSTMAIEAVAVGVVVE
jgi:hypothetical protein